MNEVELKAWNDVVHQPQQEAQKLNNTCQKYADCFQKSRLHYDHQMHYIFSYMDRFSEIHGSMNDEQGKHSIKI